MSAHPEQNQQIVPPEAPVLKPAVPRAEDLQNLSQLDPRYVFFFAFFQIF